MIKLNAISGLPRSGSTLIANILNQNPRFYASSTSPVAQLVSSLSSFATSSPEIKSEVINNQSFTEQRLRELTRGSIQGWYESIDAEVIFDKGRLWPYRHRLLSDLYPESKIIVCVRDLRNVFASIEKQHRKFPIFDEATTPDELTVVSRADRMFSPDGIIGLPLRGIEEAFDTKVQGLVIVQFERLVHSPMDTLRQMYSELGEEWFRHDTENIQSSATDVDGLYLNKFPHDTPPEIEPHDNDEWSSVISKKVADLIMSKFQTYNSTFGYR